MKVSQKWLQKYFEKPLPQADVIDEAFTFHAFEIEKRTADLIDLNVLPNRAADCLCHRGVANVLSAILDTPMKYDPLRTPLPVFPATKALTVRIEDQEKCPRYFAALVKGVKVGPSPSWLKEVLESVGQRSINNIVDAANYVMLDIGQPLHIFDAQKLIQKDGMYAVTVRGAKEGEQITTLSGDEHILPQGTLLIVDGNTDTPLGIAGIKGGNIAQVSETTTDIIIESANFDGPTIRHAAQRLKLVTDASLRFQNRPARELVAYGARDVLALITEIAGGELEGVVDVYKTQDERAPVSVTLAHVNTLLGSEFSHKEVSSVFHRLGFTVKIDGDTFTTTPPFERADIVIPQDLIEEVSSILGYDRIAPATLPVFSGKPENGHYRGIEKIKDFLVERGFTEISTQSFAKKGDIVLANPLDKTHPALRTSLTDNMQAALIHSKQYISRVLPPGMPLKLFEIGTVFTKDGERLAVETSQPVPSLPTISDDATYVPQHRTLGKYKPFSIYPFMLRDIAVWTPTGTSSSEVETIVCDNVGELLVRIDLFDSFTKDERTSYAFRMVFESPERTLTDEEINNLMAKITNTLNSENGYEVR